MASRNILYAQSGGATAVINASACGIIESARAEPAVGRVFAARNGIVGALREDLIDTGRESAQAIAALRHTPAAAFGSCRYKLRGVDENRAEYQRLIEVFEAHDIGYFLYNGGGDSADTCLKISELSTTMGYPLQAIHVPKTIDNDLPLTDNCPGFGSVAKYVAISTREAALDVAAMCESSTKVFILETMGRHAGWIAAASGLAADREGAAPHLILLPEIPFEEDRFLHQVEHSVQQFGHCVVVASEGVRHPDGSFLSDGGGRDAFGHAQLGGVAPTLAELVKARLGHKYHWAVADYLQRSARHIAAATDVEQAYAVGAAAVALAAAGRNAVMVTIERTADQPYGWRVGEADLRQVANVERKMPRHYISEDGFGITQAARDYLAPLIVGEDYPPYRLGLPDYARLRNEPLPRRLSQPFAVE